MDQKDREEIEKMIENAVLSKEEIKEDIIKPLLATVGAYHEADLKLINADLKRILQQTTLHNQRMTKIEDAAKEQNIKVFELEKNDIRHETACPHVGRIRILENEHLTSKGIKKWMLTSVAIITGMITVLFTLYKIAIKIFETLPQ